MMTSMVVTVDDIVDQLMAENKRLLNELLFANKCLKILDELKTELNLIYKKFETQLNTEDKFNHLRHQLNYICDQRRDKGLHLNDVNLDEDNEQRCKSKTTMNHIISDDMSDTQDFDNDLDEDTDEDERRVNSNTYINIENNEVMDNGIQLNDNIRREESIVEINNTEIIENKAKDNHILSKDKNIVRHQSNNKTFNLSLLCNKKDNIIEYNCLDCDNKFLTRNALTDHMFYSHKKRLVFQDNCINQQNTDLQTKNDLKKNNCQLKELTERKDKNEDNLKSITNDKTVNSSSISNIQKDPNLVFQCIDCQQMFTTPNLLADHVFSDHKKVLLLQVIPSCDQQISMKTTDTSQPIRRNININSINDKNNDQLDKQRVIRSKPGGYKCLNSDCQQTMRTLKQYRKHLSICMITCPQCHKKYKSQKSYDYHQLAAHGSGSETMYKCDYIGCNYQSVSPRSVKTHKNRYHTDRTFVCNIDGCGKSFKTNGALKYHRESHSKLEIYVCDADGCSKAFKHNSHYKRHLAEHRSEPTLKCPEKDCRRFFYTDRDIYRHRIDDHKRKVKKNLIRPYKRCDWPGCDYYGIELIRHSRVHTGEKNFHCDWPECGKRFSEKQKLNHHMNIHNNVKPYACRWPGCEYRCAHHSNINKHMKQVHHQ